VDDREQRLARNEVLFRKVNESIERTAIAHGPDEHEYEFLCECSNIDCSLRLPLTLAAYESVRSDPALFVVAPGHEQPEIEHVVRQSGSYQVVRKEGDVAELASARDPRR
jgi:hypothetical protein